jgi:hypothetical protein
LVLEEELMRRSTISALPRIATIALAAAMAVTVAPIATRSALADSAPARFAQPQMAPGSPYQRGPNPTIAMIESSHGPFATAQVNVAPGNGFKGGTIYYPTDTSLGTWGNAT